MPVPCTPAKSLQNPVLLHWEDASVGVEGGEWGREWDRTPHGCYGLGKQNDGAWSCCAPSACLPPRGFAVACLGFVTQVFWSYILLSQEESPRDLASSRCIAHTCVHGVIRARV